MMDQRIAAADLRQNPYPVYDAAERLLGWRWIDETGGDSEKLYPTQRAALRDLLAYIDYLEHGPTFWQRMWWPIRYTLWPLIVKFIHS